MSALQEHAPARRGIIGAFQCSAIGSRPAPESWAKIIGACHDGSDRLSAKERAFVADMMVLTIGYGHKPTERQGAWLKAIYARISRDCGDGK